MDKILSYEEFLEQIKGIIDIKYVLNSCCLYASVHDIDGKLLGGQHNYLSIAVTNNGEYSVFHYRANLNNDIERVKYNKNEYDAFAFYKKLSLMYL